VKATFFVIGWKVDAHPEIAQRIVDEGHSLQSHAYHHHRLTIKSSAYVGSLIDDTAAAIFDATGTTPVCLRPPGGFTNSRVAGVAAEHGHTIVLWTPNGNSLDYSHHSVSGVLRRAAGWEAGEVALLHDVWGWLHDDALPVLIDEIESRGIGFSTICVPTDVDPVPETS
jgi:peptidoglycan/xylan/chitin deacetylase (PgdA/CDA1 family)